MIRLFHVSDLHFGAEDRGALDWFATAVANEAPDAVIVTGDLTMRAKHEEFAAAADWLKRLDAPITVEVGNHDLPAANLFARFVQPYRRYNALERMIERPLQLEGVAIVPLRTTARFQWRLNWSKGNVSKNSLQHSLNLMQAVRAPIVLVVCHHPLVEAGTIMPAETRGGRAALHALAAAGAHAVLSGHVHDPFDIEHDADGRVVRLIGAGTLSERVRDSAPSFNEIRVEGENVSTAIRAIL